MKSSLFRKSTEFILSLLRNESISFYFACTCVVMVPIYTWYVPPLMVLWALARIAEMVVNKNFKLTVDRKMLILTILFAVFFLWQMISLIYSENTTNGVNILFSRLSLLIFPILFLFSIRKIKENGLLLLKLFAASTAIYIVYCFISAFFKSTTFQDGQFIFNTHPQVEYWMNYFYGSYFSGEQHPSYLAMFVTLSFFIAAESMMDKNVNKKKRIFWLSSGLLLLISIYFLSSKAGFLFMLLLLPVYFLSRFKYRNKLLITALSVAIMVLAVFSVLRTNARIKIFMDQVSDGSLKKEMAEEGRLIIWKSSVSIINKNFLTGVGIGDVRDELMKEYALAGNKDLLESRYNAHNQYLEVLLEGGIIELIIFLVMLGSMISYAFSEKNTLYGIFLLMMIVFFLFETVLYRLAGIIFFSIFSFLLLYNKEKMQHF